MLFKSLYIQGFKSFVDKTIIEFPLGITAIVGPNGSGKSNIMDAIRWVFGEQRASELRGSDMGDVIFAGSENRRPAGFAEVGLTLADLPPEVADKWGTFQDITVTRKMYRSGEREYLINGRKCRLKDIKDIFFDTGLGTKSISIIEQERVTKIVNSSPEELRYFLEETAGVIRYKERRREAEQRLKQTRENLNRIEDILTVLSGDLNRLSEQVAQVQRYRQLKEEKSSHEKAFFCVAYSQYVKEKADLESKLEKSRETASSVIKENQIQIDEETSLQRNRLGLIDKLRLMREEYEGLKDGLAAAEGDIRQYEANIESAGQQKIQIEQDIEAASEQIERVTQRLADISETIQDTFDLVSDFEDKVEECAAEIAEYKAMQERVQDEIKRHNKKYLEITQKHTELSNNINLKQASLANHKASANRLAREKEEMLAEGGGLDERIEECWLKAAELESQKNAAAEKLAGMEKGRAAQEKELSELDNECSALKIALKTSENRISLLRKEIESKMAGSADDIISSFSGKAYAKIHQLNEEKYLQYADLFVFADDMKDALLGRLKNEDVSLRFVFEADLPKLEDEQPLVRLDGRVYVQGCVYRSIGGDDPALALLNLQQNLQSEQAHAEEYREKLLAFTNRADDLRDEYGLLKEAINETAAGLKQIELEYGKITAELKHLEDLKGKTLRNISVIDKEIELSAKEAEIAERELEALAEKRVQILSLLEKADDERLLLEEKLTNIADRLDELREEHASAMRELARYTERKSALQAEKTQLLTDKGTIRKRLDALTARLSDLTGAQLESWHEKLAIARDKKIEYTKGVLRSAEKIKDAETEQTAIDERLDVLRAALAKINDTLHEMDITNAGHKSKLETVNANMDEIQMQVRAAYEADITAIYREIAASAPSKTKIQELISAADAAINALGPLNMAAEGEYEEKNTQFKTQVEQKADIERAIVDLSALISEIDDSTVQLFSDTFTAVRKNFREVFTRFFGDSGTGFADLRLTEPDNMLMTGVEILINPPGKKLSNKNLLSGGEKALAALTLLFALFLEKPTPFCFLDEVDAPLDDENAARFISMVRSLAANTQFVIITHKHQTMSSADSLYGVTMQEGGVSTMLSVELT